MFATGMTVQNRDRERKLFSISSGPSLPMRTRLTWSLLQEHPRGTQAPILVH